MPRQRSILYFEPRSFSNEFHLYFATTPEARAEAEKIVDSLDPLKSSARWVTRREYRSLVSWARRERAWFEVYTYNPDNPGFPWEPSEE